MKRLGASRGNSDRAGFVEDHQKARFRNIQEQSGWGLAAGATKLAAQCVLVNLEPLRQELLSVRMEDHSLAVVNPDLSNGPLILFSPCAGGIVLDMPLRGMVDLVGEGLDVDRAVYVRLVVPPSGVG
jgi:hypothetical protein